MQLDHTDLLAMP